MDYIHFLCSRKSREKLVSDASSGTCARSGSYTLAIAHQAARQGNASGPTSTGRPQVSVSSHPASVACKPFPVPSAFPRPARRFTCSRVSRRRICKNDITRLPWQAPCLHSPLFLPFQPPLSSLPFSQMSHFPSLNLFPLFYPPPLLFSSHSSYPLHPLPLSSQIPCSPPKSQSLPQRNPAHSAQTSPIAPPPPTFPTLPTQFSSFRRIAASVIPQPSSSELPSILPPRPLQVRAPPSWVLSREAIARLPSPPERRGSSDGLAPRTTGL